MKFIIMIQALMKTAYSQTVFNIIGFNSQTSHNHNGRGGRKLSC